MMKRTGLVAGLVCAVLGSIVPALAQQPSLAEIARQEATRRKAVESSKKVYTDKDLNKGRPLTTGASTSNSQATEARDAEPVAAAPAADAKAADHKDGGATNDPRLVELRMALATATEGASAANLAVDKSNVTIVNLFDEAQRNAEIARRDAKIGEFRKLQATVDALNKEIAELEEAAKKSSSKTPPQ